MESPAHAPDRRRDRLLFFQAFLRDPATIGAVMPSSRPLAHALMEPFRSRTAPAKVLEVGAGTGAITRHLGSELGEQDELTVCEPHPDLARHLSREVLSHPRFRRPVLEGRVSVLACPVEDMDGDDRFDYIIAGLPFTAFELSHVETILKAVRRMLRRGGVFSYFEYVALRRLKRQFSLGAARRRNRAVSTLLDDHIGRYEVARRTVVANVPPAYARHWRFDQDRP